MEITQFQAVNQFYSSTNESTENCVFALHLTDFNFANRHAPEYRYVNISSLCSIDYLRCPSRLNIRTSRFTFTTLSTKPGLKKSSLWEA